MIRQATDADLAALETVAAAMGTTHEDGYFARCLQEQTDGNRTVLVADSDNGYLTGYVQLIWSPIYTPFKRLGIPEIQDLNVIPAARRQGIGEQLVIACEDLARTRGTGSIGIGVGLHAAFGAAQRLYIRRGYMPDGAGACYDDVPVRPYEMRPVDDQLTIKLVKDFV